MTLEQWRDLFLVIYAVFWTIAGVVLLGMAILLYRRLTVILDTAKEAGAIISTVAGVGAVVREVINVLSGNRKEET